MKHFWKKNAEQPEDATRIKSWCGREVRAAESTSTLTSVECRQCREAFAKVLRELPDFK